MSAVSFQGPFQALAYHEDPGEVLALLCGGIDKEEMNIGIGGY